MRKIRIFNQDHSLEAQILPDFGAMISDIRLQGKQVLWFDEEMLGLGNVLAGGNPILFPFAGKTTGDTLIAAGREYSMPMHGFIKDCPFDVESQTDYEAVLVFSSDERLERLVYPYPFTLRMIYRFDGNCLAVVAEVVNRGREDMPVAIGYHPYFKTTDKRSTRLEFTGGAYADYVACGLNGEPRRGVLESGASVADDYDHVFHEGGCADFHFENRADGYCLELKADDSFRVLTLSTRHDGSACIEPWQGTPNAANDPGVRLLVPAGASRKFSCNMYLSSIS